MLGLSVLAGCSPLPSGSQPATEIPALRSAVGSAIPRFHVDPAGGSDSAAGRSPGTAFKSLERARDAVRALPRPLTSDVEVVLADGDYPLARPFALTAADSGDNGRFIRYTAAPGATPRLDGGLRVTGWSPHDTSRGIYSATLPRPVDSRQLFVNGRRAVRARSVGGLDELKREPFGYTLPAASVLASWKNPADLEFVYRHIWTNPRAGVAAIERRPDAVHVTMDQPGFDNGRHKGITSIDRPWYLENAYELLDEAGEWYLDRTGAVGGQPHTVYYKPHDWEDLRTAIVVLPVLEHLVTVEGGGIAAPARNIAFHGLTFQHTTWLRPSSPFGLPDAQNNVMRENFARFGKATGDQESIIDGAALRLRYATDIQITRSRFTGLGGMGVCFATAGAQNNLIEGNTFADIAATGLQIGDYAGWESPDHENAAFPLDPHRHAAANQIRNNYFNRCGVEYRSATAIGLAFPRDTTIAYNEIYNVPYIGLHLGWGWIRIPKSAMGGNLIESNLIQNTMVELADGACIYTLGPSDPDHAVSVVRGNYVRQTRWGHGLYFDERSSRYEVADNLVLATGDANVKFNGIDNREIRVTGLFSEKTRNIISEKLDVDKLSLSIAPVSPIDAPEHAAAVARIKADAGLQPAFVAARDLPLDAVIHEFEEGAVANGAYATNGMGDKPVAFGYSGMGFLANFARRPGAGATLTARVSRAGEYQIRFRYSAPEKDVPGLLVSANGTESALPVFPSTRAHNSWALVTHPVRLKAGVNTLAFTASRALEGAFFADRIELVPMP